MDTTPPSSHNGDSDGEEEEKQDRVWDIMDTTDLIKSDFTIKASDYLLNDESPVGLAFDVSEPMASTPAISSSQPSDKQATKEDETQVEVPKVSFL